MPNIAVKRTAFDSHSHTPPRHGHGPARQPALSEKELTAVYRRYRQQVLTRCRRILRDDQQAEDATQTTFLKLWLYGHSFALAESPLSWLYRVAERCCFDELRRRAPLGDGVDTEELPAASSAGDSVEDRDLARRFLGSLDVRVGQIAVLRYCEQSSMDEIAEETRWSRQTVFKKLLVVQERARALRGTLCGEQR